MPQAPTSAREALERAASLRRALTATDEERALRRLEAVEAYRDAARLGGDSELASEAHFRAGELLRSAGDSAGARTEFEACQALGSLAFGLRARFEIGHLERREGRWQRALDAYLEVATAARASPAQRMEALLWMGKVWRGRGRSRDARRVWECVVRAAHDPVRRIRAYDLLALERLDRGDWKAARARVDRCLATTAAAAEELGEQGSRVRRALANMRARRLLDVQLDEHESQKNS